MSLPDLSKISTVLLDMDGTLLDLHFDDYFWNHYLHRRYATIHEVPVDHAETHVRTTLEAAHGSLTWYCTDHWSRTFCVDILALKRELAHLIRYRTGTEAFLEFLSRSGHQVILVTNAHPDVLSLKDEHTGVRSRIPAHVTSHDYGAPKESSEFWKRLVRDHCFDEADALLIDDSRPVLHAARAFGVGAAIAVRQPNSSREPQELDGFPHVDDLSTLTGPLANAAGANPS